MLCLRKIPVAKSSMDKKWGIKVFRRKNFVSQCRKLSKVNLSVLCFRKNPVAKKIMYKMGGISRFSVEVFGLTMPKTFATESFCVVFQKTSGSEKDYG